MRSPEVGHVPVTESRLRILLVAAVMLLAPVLSIVPPTTSASPVVVDRFTDGSTGARLDLSKHVSNDTLALEVPRGAQVTDAELTVTGIEGSSIVDARMDFDTDPVGDDLWALFEWNSTICPPEVDPYDSGWQVASDSDVDSIAKDDDTYWDVMGHSMSSSQYHYPFQLYHFRTEGLPAISYTVSWNGYGNCDANKTATYQATLWLYNHTSSSWEDRASYGSDDSGDVWLESTFLPTDAFMSTNGSVDALLMGPPGEYRTVVPPDPVWGHIVTDYVALKVGIPGRMEYPQNATLRLGVQQLNLSAGPLDGQVKLDDALGFKDALQAAIDAEVVMPGTIVIPFTFSVQWRTLSMLEVGGLSVTYEPAVNAPPVWRGPTAVEVDEDSPWAEALDLGTAFSDDWNQEELRYSIVNVSDPTNLSTRMQFGLSGNWTLAVKPAPDFFGDVMVTLNATDLFGEATPSATFTMRVRQVPDHPSIEDPGELHATEGERFVYTPRASDPDMPDDVLTWFDASDLLDVNGTTGAIDWTPGKDHIGTHRVQVVVQDRFGLQGTMTFAIVVANVNDPPVITSPLTLKVDQDQAVVYNITASDPDTPFGDVVGYFAFSEEIEVQCDMATGEVTFTPTNDNIGPLEISLRAQDKAGLKDDRTLTVTVRNVNDPPVLQGPGPQVHDQGETVSVRFVATDPDLSVAGAGERITLTSDGPPGLRPNAAGWVNVTLEQDHVGVWWVNSTLTDAAGLTSKVVVVWTITDVNDPPRPPGSIDPPWYGVVREGHLVTFNFSAYDIDGDTLTWSDDCPLFDIDPSTGVVSFTPEQEDVGEHHITITISDGHSDYVFYEFNIVIYNVNDLPVISNVAPLNGTSYKEGETISFLASATDEDGDTLTLIWREGARELGRGSPFATSGLRPGRHTITLIVDDGNATVESHLDVVVKEREGGIGPMAVLLVVAIVAAVAIVASVLAMRSRRGRPSADQEPASLAGPEGAAGGAAAKAPEGEEPPKIEIEYREV